jgi:toxin ParE1/3/4
VATFRFSNRALADLDAIAAYTIRTWGEAQAARYLDRLEAMSRCLVDLPGRGRRCEHIRPGLWRIEEGRHVLFFRRQGDDILICRILHERMLPERHPIDDDEFEPPRG